jgi:hypothetical protein
MLDPGGSEARSQILEAWQAFFEKNVVPRVMRALIRYSLCSLQNIYVC